MAKKAGEKTGEFGYWLKEHVCGNPDYQGMQVYYDHGDPKLDNHVVVINAFLGKTVTQVNKLAEVDVMVVNQENEILLLIEIEESPISPKTLLGDVFACLLSSGFAVKVEREQVYFHVTNQTQLWVVGTKAGRTNLIDQVQEKINRIVFDNEIIPITKVRLIIENELESCLESLKEESLNYLLNR